MNTMRNSKLLLALFALLLVFGACKGESPTAPPTGGGGGGGGNPQPNTFDMSLTASNASPVVDSTSIITATVTRNGSPAPNGTAVEFVASSGSLDGGGTSIIKTTTNGVASVTLTATVAGAVTVNAVVANVSRNVTVTFRAGTVPPVPPVTTPTIDSITPAIGRPQGGEIIRITGKNFKPPVRVLFDTGGPLPLEALVVSATETLIEVISPAVNLGSGQNLAVDVIVITGAGQATEARVEREDFFTYRNEQLIPAINTASPNSGPVTGGTRVTIFGEGFQAPVQVLFGSAEARVINVDFNQIIVEAPAGRDTSDDGSGVVTGPVDITVRNIQSGTQDVMTGGFSYKAAVAVIAAGPGGGPFTGGTRIEIDGIGFVAPVSVVIRTPDGDITLQPINVTGTRIIAITPAITIENCEGPEGPIVVTNIVNGDQAEGPIFTFTVPQPIIVNVASADPTDPIINEGDTIVVTVANAQGGLARFRLGDRSVFPTSESFDPASGTATYTLAVPFNFDFPTESCSIAGLEGERETELTLDVTYENVTTGCEDTATDALTVEPDDPTCQTDPAPVANVEINPENGSGCANPPAATVGGASTNATITFTNSGTAPLTVSAATPTGANADDFAVTPPQRTIGAGLSGDFTVQFTPSATGARNASVSFTTNDPTNGTIVVCLQGTGNAPAP